MTANCLSGFAATRAQSASSENGRTYARPGVSPESFQIDRDAYDRANWAIGVKRLRERLKSAPEIALVGALGFSAAAYLGFYQGVVGAVVRILDHSLSQPIAPLDLLEGLIQMLLGWVVFLVIALATAMLVREGFWSRLSRSAESTPELREKEHERGYD